MKKMILTVALLAVASLTFAQNNALQITATGTGRTTGHIANLSLYNPTNQTLTAEIGPCFIPSGGQYQPYIVPSVTTTTVPPGTTANIPVNGYCTDIFTAPVPAGAAMPTFSSWATPEQNATAATLLDAIRHISTAFDNLKNKGTISTPFSGNPEKERESVIQQTFWIHTSELNGKEYKKESFKTNTIKQFETATGLDFEKTDEKTQANVNAGVEQFWSVFEAVGTEAKVLSKAGNGPGETIPINNENCSTCLDDGKCECGEISFDLLVTHYSLKIQNDGNKNKREYNQKQPVKTPVKEDSQSGVGKDKIQDAAEIKPAVPGVKAGDEVGISLANVKIDCPCTNGTSCEAYKSELPQNKEGQEGQAKIKKAIDADAALGKAKEEVAKIEEELTAAKTEMTKKNAENKLKKAKEKVIKLEKELEAAQKDLQSGGLGNPNIKVNGKDASGSWDTTTGTFTFDKNGDIGLKVDKVPFTCEFEISFHCQSFKCDGVRCVRKFKVTL